MGGFLCYSREMANEEIYIILLLLLLVAGVSAIFRAYLNYQKRKLLFDYNPWE